MKPLKPEAYARTIAYMRKQLAEAKTESQARYTISLLEALGERLKP